MTYDYDDQGLPLYDEGEPDEFDYDDDESEVVDCPSCGAQVYEDAEQCPECGDYIVADTSVWSGRPWWWVALALMGVLATTAALVLH